MIYIPLVEEQLAVQNLLRSNLLLAQSKNPKYSLRSYSKKVGIHVGALSYIMNGKRNVSRKLAEKITRKLLIDPVKRSEILSLFPEKRKYKTIAEKEAAPEPKFLQIEASEFKLIAEWEHYAVLNLIKTKDFKSDLEWIAERLGITVTRVRDVVERLVILGFMKKDVKGNLSRIEAQIRSSDDTVDMSVRKSHDESLELARESLHRDSIKERDFTSMTLAIDPAKMDAAKEKIRKFQDDISDLLTVGETTEVYRLAIQLFPITKLKNSNSIKKGNIQ